MMDIATLAGLILALGLIGWAIVMGGDVSGYIDPASVLITVGGTLAATIAGSRLADLAKLLRLALLLVRHREPDDRGLVETIVTLAQKARREGLLALDSDAQETNDTFLRKGLELVVDGTEPEVLRTTLEIEIGAMEARHEHGAGLFRKMAGAAPAFGMIGTLIGLIRMLGVLDDPNSIGPGLATALLTTLYGSLMANVFFIPAANKLEAMSHREAAHRDLCLTGILALQSGDSPRLIEQKLAGFLEPRSRARANTEAPTEQGDEPQQPEEAVAND